MKTQQFEEKIQSSFALPEPSPEFEERLARTLRAKVHAQKITPRRQVQVPRAWAYAFATLAALVIVVFALGPQKVLAQIQSWLGFLPGIGLVSDDASSLRVLAEPASQTLDGITVEVSEAVASSDKTYVNYQVFGLTNQHFPAQESDPGCHFEPNLKLPNGTNLAFANGYYEAVPKEINQVVLHLACIPGTDSAKTPSNWQIPFTLKTADDLVTMPVLLPEPQVYRQSDQTFGEAIDDSSALHIHTVVETPKGYIMTGWVETDLNIALGPMNPKLIDSNGKEVQTRLSQQASDLMQNIPAEHQFYAWGFEFDSEGLSFPLNVSFSVLPKADQNMFEPIHFMVDLGANPQNDQVWEFQQTLSLGTAQITINKVQYLSQNRLKLFFTATNGLIDLDIQFPDLQVSGGGGGGHSDASDSSMSFERSFVFETTPKGIVEILFTDPVFAQDAVDFSSVWQPATPHAPYPEMATHTCPSLAIDSSQSNIPVFDQAYIALYRQISGDPVKYELIYRDSHATERLALSDNAVWGSISPDSTQALFPKGLEGSTLQNLSDNQKQILAGIIANDSKWSPDGNYIAYLRGDGAVFNMPAFAKVDGTEANTISELGYAMIAGWSPDSRTIYFTLPWFNSSSWKVMAYDIESDETKELFTIQNGTIKFLDPQISPDGKWLSYRGVDNSSLYLVSLDGETERLILDDAHVVKHIWLDDTHIALSISYFSGTYENYVLNLNDCSFMRLDDLDGGLVDMQLKN
ncbi:MAG TPA: hypothetical protein PK381_01530 [Anaerolineaceae bacterium]|mgnify:FL=1|nr:hypothetical protein [Anaerolineaceae bacterium]